MSVNHDSIPSHVADQLADKLVLLIGGNRRPDQLARLQATFPRTRFHWCPTRESDASLSTFEHLIELEDVAFVVILHGLARTGHTKGTRRLCSSLHKPLLWCRRPTAAAIVRSLSSFRLAA